MKKLFTSAALLTLMLFAFIQTSHATHIVGTDFSYTCIGQDSFLVTLNIYRDCSGISAPASATVTFSSTCGQGLNQNLTLMNGPTGTEVSQLSPSNLANSSCNGGTLPGVQHYEYTGIVLLSPACNTWTMNWSSCCRNTTVNLTGQPGTYIEATMNSSTANCNNSPVFNGIPIPYVCLNQQVNYNVVASEPDGDSLVYSFTDPKGLVTTIPTIVPFATGFNSNNPIPGIAINTSNGQITFTPTIAGNYVVAVKIEEYDYSTGLLKGTVIRDFQFVVIGACSNSHPIAPPSITNFSGTAILTAPKTIQACVGNSFDFDLVFTDPDTSDSVTITSNILDALPGATVTVVQGNPATISVSWIATSGLQPVIPLIITAKDDASGILGFESTVLNINLNSSTTAGPDITICEGTQWAQVNATGGNLFSWTLHSGSPIDTIPSSPGYNMNCTNCANPQISPSSTSTYIVTSNLAGLCVNVDTITIAVVPNFDLTMPADTLICPNNSVSLNASTNQTFSYSYQWSESNTLNNDSILTPMASPSSPTNYQLIVTSAAGCQKVGNVFIDVSGDFPGDLFLSGDTVLCNGQTTFLEINEFSGLDSSFFNYAWYPTNGLNATNNLNTLATPTSSITYNVIVSDTNGVCVDTLHFFVDVVSTFDAGFHFNDPYCISASTDQFTPNVGGGTFSGNGVNANGVFDPALAGIGSWPITYSITSPASCANDSIINVVVIPLPDASFQYVEICETGQPINLTPINPGGTWVGLGITDSLNGTFDPSGISPGTYAITYSLTQPCANTNTLSVKIIEPYIFTASAYIEVCQGSTIDLNNEYTQSSGVNQGSGPVLATWLDANGAVNTNGIFDASNLATGTYTVNLTLSDSMGNCGTLGAMDVTVLQTNIPEFPGNLTFCEQTTNATIMVTPWLFGTGTSYTQTPLGSLNPNDSLNISQFGSNGKFNPSALGVGNWEIQVTYTNLNGCTGIGTDTIHVLETPDITVTANASGLTSNATGAYSYQWIDCASGLPVAGATNQTFSPTVAGNYQVEVSAGTCSGVSACKYSAAVGIAEPLANFGITVYPNPIINILTVNIGANTNVGIEISDLSGKVIFKTTAQNQKTEVDLSEYASGVYLIKLDTENGTAIQKVVKK